MVWPPAPCVCSTTCNAVALHHRHLRAAAVVAGAVAVAVAVTGSIAVSAQCITLCASLNGWPKATRRLCWAGLFGVHTHATRAALIHYNLVSMVSCLDQAASQPWKMDVSCQTLTRPARLRRVAAHLDPILCKHGCTAEASDTCKRQKSLNYFIPTASTPAKHCWRQGVWTSLCVPHITPQDRTGPGGHSAAASSLT